MKDEWQQWRRAVERGEVDSAVGDLYARLDADIAAYGPTCWSSGKCCKFDSYGHRLYVTGLEIARFFKHNRTACPPQASGQAVEPFHPLPVLNITHQPSDIKHQDSCVFQIDGLCSTHKIRPLGCRVFFCQKGTQDWQQELYEQYLNELRVMHERWGLPYRYMEWRAGVEECVMADV